MSTDLAALIHRHAAAQWADENSLTAKNRTSLPPDVQDGFIVDADMGGITFLDSTGKLRVFTHDDAQEIEVAAWVRRVALKTLAVQAPEIAKLLAW